MPMVSSDGLLDDSITKVRKLERAFSICTPCWVTELGSRGVARDRRFCTSTWARSSLVPFSKVSDSVPVPSAWATDSMYMRPGEPFISRSMMLSTLSSSVWAEAPG